jgi:hypothetical protein
MTLHDDVLDTRIYTPPPHTLHSPPPHYHSVIANSDAAWLMEWQYEQFATCVMIYVVMNIWWIIVWIEGQPNIAVRRYGFCVSNKWRQWSAYICVFVSCNYRLPYLQWLCHICWQINPSRIRPVEVSRHFFIHLPKPLSLHGGEALIVGLMGCNAVWTYR